MRNERIAYLKVVLNNLEKEDLIRTIVHLQFGTISVYKADGILCDFVVLWMRGLEMRGVFTVRKAKKTSIITFGNETLGQITLNIFQNALNSKWQVEVVN